MPMGVGEPSSHAGVVGVASVGVGVAAEAPDSWVGAWSEEDCAGDCADCAWLSALGWREPQAVAVIVRVRITTEAMPMRCVARQDQRDAYIRASVYEVPELASNHTPTPDLERGQGEFLPLLANRAHTTVTITGSNNHGQQPNTDPTRWYGNVYYLRNYSDDSLEPVKGREVVFLRLQDDGTWAVVDSGPY